jgi:hypothetical protein
MKRLIMTVSGAAIALSLMSAAPALATQAGQSASSSVVADPPGVAKRTVVKIKIVYKCKGDC